jgi:hypothetical protein
LFPPTLDAWKLEVLALAALVEDGRNNQNAGGKPRSNSPLSIDLAWKSKAAANQKFLSMGPRSTADHGPGGTAPDNQATQRR